MLGSSSGSRRAQGPWSGSASPVAPCHWCAPTAILSRVARARSWARGDVSRWWCGREALRRACGYVGERSSASGPVNESVPREPAPPDVDQSGVLEAIGVETLVDGVGLGDEPFSAGAASFF